MLAICECTLLLLRSDQQHLRVVKAILDEFGRLSDLKINLAKSQLLFTIADDDNIQELAQIIGCTTAKFPFKNVIFPLSNKKLGMADFDHLIQRIANRLTGWQASLLSIAGRLILMHAILSAMPTYFITVFMLPKGIIKKIDRIQRKFLLQRNKAALMNGFAVLTKWSDVIAPKELEGLGIKDLHAMNKALMLKWFWYSTQSNKR
jgi:hypothetical protein